MTAQTLSCRFFTLKNRRFASIHSIYCEITLNSIKSFGRGDSWSSSEAKHKAFGEAIERIVLKDGAPGNSALSAPKNSNGLAFHYSKTEAVSRAKRELIERELVMRAWIGLSSVQLMKYKKTSLKSNKASEICDSLIANKNQIYILYFGDVSGVSTIGISIESEKSPYSVFGYSASENIEAAIEKALFEAVILHEGYQSFIGDHSDENLKNRFIKNIQYYAENKNELTNVFTKSTNCNSFEILKNRVDTHEISTEIFELKSVGLPGYIVRATHPDFHTLHAGCLTEDYGNRQIGETHPIG